MVALRTPTTIFTWYKACGDFLCRVFCATRFLNTSFQLQKLVSKTYKAKLSTADAWYVVEGKITFIAVVQKRWSWFWTVQEHLKELKLKTWVESMSIFRAFWLSVVEKLHLTLTFSGKVVCIWSSKGNQSHALSTQNEGKHFLSKTLLCVHTTWNLIWEFQWTTGAGYI